MIKRFLFDVANRDAGHVLYVSNLDEVLADLKLIDPQARKAFNKDTRNILKPYLATAKGFIPTESPLRNWKTTIPTYTSASWANDTTHRGRDAVNRWRWDSGQGQQEITITRGSFRSRTLTFDNIIGLKNASISGKMMELIGQGKQRRSAQSRSRNPNAGINMRDNMNRKHGSRKRVVWKILEDSGAQIGAQMEKIIDPILARFGRER